MRALIVGLARTSGAAALRRGLPVYVGLLAATGLLFGGNGLSAPTVIAGAAESPLARALLWTGWLVALTPTLAAVWQTRASFWLRSLPVARGWHLAVAVGLSVIAESLWTLLWGLGGGWLAAAAGLGGALAGHAIVLARPTGVWGVIVVGLMIAGLVWAPLPILAFATWPIALLAFRTAWLRAPTIGATGGRLGLAASSSATGLASALLRSVIRGQAAALLRGALVVALATAAAWLAARTNQTREAADLQVYLCGFLAPAALLVGSAGSGPLLQIEQAAQWLLVTVSRRTRLAGMLLALLAAAVVQGLVAGLALAWSTGTGAVRLAAAGAATATAMAAIAGLAARWTEQFAARGPGRLVVALLLTAIASLASLAWLETAAPWAWLAAAGLIWLLVHVRSASPTVEREGDGAVVLNIEGVRKRLGTRIVLEQIDLRCPAGEVALVLGDNGAGKSTLLRIAAGIVEPDRGFVTVDGFALAGGAAAGRGRLGYAPDTADAFPELSVREFVELVAALKQAPPPEPPLGARLGLAGLWDQRMRTLSFGQVKRTYLLAATIGAPPLWVLDEPSNGLDPDGGALVAQLLAEHAARGGAALVSTNDARFVELCRGRRLRLASGRLATA